MEEGIKLNKIQKNKVLQLNELDELRVEALH